jgi:threonyl-tRNA synthetase
MEATLSQEIERSIRKTTLVTNIMSIAVTLASGMAVTFGFYYKTNANIQIHDKQIVEIRKDVKETIDKVSKIEVFKGVSSTELLNLNKEG